jgi:integrase
MVLQVSQKLSVSERLGHASVAITLDIYSHVLPGLQEAAVEKSDTLFSTSIILLHFRPAIPYELP